MKGQVSKGRWLLSSCEAEFRLPSLLPSSNVYARDKFRFWVLGVWDDTVCVIFGVFFKEKFILICGIAVLEVSRISTKKWPIGVSGSCSEYNVPAWRKYLDEFSPKKTTKTVVTEHALYGIWVVYYVEAVTIEFVLLMERRAWISEEGIISFRIFVSLDVVLLVLMFSCFVFALCWGEIKYSKITMFFSELSFVVEKYVKYFPFSGITELTKREKELSNSTSSSAKRSMRFRHAWGSAVFFQTSGYVDV